MSSCYQTLLNLNSNFLFFFQEPYTKETEPYDEWLCIQKALEEHNTRPLGHHLDNRKGPVPVDLFHPHHEVHKEAFNDLFANQSNAAAPSPLSELFSDQPKPNMDDIFAPQKSDMVESRLEALFEGTNTESEDALDNASFLHKNPEISYEMVQALSAGKRQWAGNCGEIMESPNTSNFVVSKRQCLTSGGVADGGGSFTENSDNSRWMMDCQQDSFEFESISSCESSSQPATSEKRIWNGGEIGLAVEPEKIHLDGGNGGYDHHAAVAFDEDISQQVQNAIDSILNLQGMESDFSLDQTIGSLLSDNSPSVRPPSAAKRKYIPNHVNMVNHDSLGGCLIGGSTQHGGSLDDSPTQSLAQASSSSGANTPISQDAFGSSSGLDETVKSIMTS